MGMARNPANTRHVCTFRLPSDLVERLDSEAAARVLGRSKLVEMLLRRGLDSLDPAPTGDDTRPTSIRLFGNQS